MLPLKFIAINTLHIFLNPTVYLLCRKICEYKSYTGMKNRSKRKFPCMVQSKIKLFCNFVTKIGLLSRKPTCFSNRIHKNSYKKDLDYFIDAKMKMSMLSRPNMVNFHFKVTLIFAYRVHVAQWELMISFEILSAFIELEYNKN